MAKPTYDCLLNTELLHSHIFGDIVPTNGEYVINEPGDDVNFRVEGDTDQNLFFTDAGNDRVGIGTNAPNLKLDVIGKAAIGDSLTTARLNSAVGPRAVNLIDTNAVLRVWRFSDDGDEDPAIELGWGTTSDDLANASNSWWDIYLDGITDTLYMRSRSGGVNTDLFSLNTTGFSFERGGTIDGSVTINSGLVVNEDSDNVDFRVESNNNTNMIFVDGGSNQVGIGTGSPEVELHVDGQGAFGDSITTTRINSALGPRAINLIDSSAVVRVWRFTNNTGSDPAIELGWGNNDNLANAANIWWDIFVDASDNGIVFRERSGGSNVNKMRITSAGELAVGTDSPSAQIHADQSSTSGAKPVLLLDQADVSEEFVRLVGTSTTDASQSLVDAADLTTPGSIVGWFKIYIQDDQTTNPITDGVYYVPFYSAPTA